MDVLRTIGIHAKNPAKPYRQVICEILREEVTPTKPMLKREVGARKGKRDSFGIKVLTRFWGEDGDGGFVRD